MKMTRLHQWAIIVIVTIVALFGMSSSSTASETKDITIWAYDNWAKAAEKAVEIYQNNNPNSGYIFHVNLRENRVPGQLLFMGKQLPIRCFMSAGSVSGLRFC